MEAFIESSHGGHGGRPNRSEVTAMTGCDLRYLATELAEGTRSLMQDRAALLANVGVTANLLADSIDVPLLADLCFKVRQIASLINEQVGNLRSDAPDRYDAAMDVIEKIRAHFHEAVDERVEAEVRDGDYLDEEAVDEKVREAVDEAVESLKSNIESNVIQAIRDAEVD